MKQKFITRSLCSCLALGFISLATIKAEEVVSTRTSDMIGGDALSIFSYTPEPETAPLRTSPSYIRYSWGGGGWIRRIVHNVVAEVRDRITQVTNSVRDASPAELQSLLAQAGDSIKYILERPVRIKAEINGFMHDKYVHMLDHRPEWFIEPPPWLRSTLEKEFGVSIDDLNNIIDVAVMVNHGDFSLNDATKQLIIDTIVKEARIKAENATRAWISDTVPAGPIVVLLFDSRIKYGFDRLEDKANDKVSQYFIDGNNGATQAKTLISNGNRVLLSITDGATLPSIVIANAICIGSSTDPATLTYVTNGSYAESSVRDPNFPNRVVYTPKTTYITAVGGIVRIAGNVIINGNVTISSVSSAANLSTELKARVNELKTSNAGTAAWVDSVLSLTSPSSNG